MSDVCSRFINPSLVIYYLRIALPKIKRHFLYDRRRPYIELFDEQNNSIYGRLRPYKKCIQILEGGGEGENSSPSIKRHFLYDRRRPYIELFCSSNNSIYDRLRSYNKCLLILGRGRWIPPSHDYKALFIWPKTVIYRIVLFVKQFYIWPSSVI